MTFRNHLSWLVIILKRMVFWQVAVAMDVNFGATSDPTPVTLRTVGRFYCRTPEKVPISVPSSVQKFNIDLG